jgi:hypothetical protein
MSTDSPELTDVAGYARTPEAADFANSPFVRNFGYKSSPLDVVVGVSATIGHLSKEEQAKERHRLEDDFQAYQYELHQLATPEERQEYRGLMREWTADHDGHDVIQGVEAFNEAVVDFHGRIFQVVVDEAEIFARFLYLTRHSQLTIAEPLPEGEIIPIDHDPAEQRAS